MVDASSAWGEFRVYFKGPGGGLMRILAAWTDFVEPDPFVVVAAGRSPLHARSLLRLADLVQQLRAATQATTAAAAPEAHAFGVDDAARSSIHSIQIRKPDHRVGHFS